MLDFFFVLLTTYIYPEHRIVVLKGLGFIPQQFRLILIFNHNPMYQVLPSPVPLAYLCNFDLYENIMIHTQIPFDLFCTVHYKSEADALLCSHATDVGQTTQHLSVTEV